MKKLLITLSIFVLTIACVKAIPSPQPDLEGCSPPPPDVFTKVGVDINFAQSTYGKVVQGAISELHQTLSRY